LAAVRDLPADFLTAELPVSLTRLLRCSTPRPFDIPPTLLSIPGKASSATRPSSSPPKIGQASPSDDSGMTPLDYRSPARCLPQRSEPQARAQRHRAGGERWCRSGDTRFEGDTKAVHTDRQDPGDRVWSRSPNSNLLLLRLYCEG